MSYYVGIDLGTTNSAICLYDGEKVQLIKSPNQEDVTPSAIFYGRRGAKYVGRQAYDQAPDDSERAATKFKRMMGTNTPINLPAVNLTLTPEQCSAEILSTCFGYLPEEVRNDPNTGTVITVPAAFNQMQKDATMAAAEMAGLGRVALMQEPVAAVMSVMRQRRADGRFLVYDLGGGTLDIAVAQAASGRVSLLAHGGIAMCGGADFDAKIVRQIVEPWLFANFVLPDDASSSGDYKRLFRVITYAAERAKIELSARDEAIIHVEEDAAKAKDEAGKEIYLDIPIGRPQVDALIADLISESIDAAKSTLTKAGLESPDIERVVFVGGPTQYKPLRDRVAGALGIAASTEVNPMTAVAEGAAIFAESVDWSSQTRGRKASRGTLDAGGGLNLTFKYQSRTPSDKAKIVAAIAGSTIPGCEFQVDCQDTGTSSGRLPLKDGASVEVALSKAGDNFFKIFVFDSAGGNIDLGDSRITITRTAATIEAIPASSSIGIEVIEKNRSEVLYLIREGDPLPHKGQVTLKALASVRAGSATDEIRIPLWEGEIADPVNQNEYIGTLNIRGADFDEGVITEGADLLCDFEFLDSGQIKLEVTVPSVRGTFNSGRNFYSRKEGGRDFSVADELKRIESEAEGVRAEITKLATKVDDERLEKGLTKLDEATTTVEGNVDPEAAKQALENVQKAKRLVADIRKDHAKVIWQTDLDGCLEFFNRGVRKYARPSEVEAFDNLVRTAQRAINEGRPDFKSHLDAMRERNWEILWRQDWFVVDTFKDCADQPWQFGDKKRYSELVRVGREAVKSDDIDSLRHVVVELYSLRVSSGSDEGLMPSTVMRGR